MTTENLTHAQMVEAAKATERFALDVVVGAIGGRIQMRIVDPRAGSGITKYLPREATFAEVRAMADDMRRSMRGERAVTQRRIRAERAPN